MNKKIVQAVLERSEGLCEVQGCYAPGTELHHLIFGSGKRKQHETVESVKLLCYEHHRGTSGIHGKNGRELDLKLKRELQEEYFNMGYKENEVRQMLGGKLY